MFVKRLRAISLQIIYSTVYILYIVVVVVIIIIIIIIIIINHADLRHALLKM